jgi:four helix bundle protein
MQRTNFEKLEIYRLSEQLADLVWTVATEWDHRAWDTVGRQVVRSADSIGANLAEGSGRGSQADRLRFVRYARGSLYETKHWLRRAVRRDLVTAEQITALKALVDELVPRLNAYYRALRRRPSEPSPKPQDPSSES